MFFTHVKTIVAVINSDAMLNILQVIFVKKEEWYEFI
jgi:hypothetical protein